MAKTSPTTLFDLAPGGLLTVHLTKRLECGHERVDAQPSKLGDAVHCWMCSGLSDVVAVTFPPRQMVTDVDRIRLVQAGYTTDEVRMMEIGQDVADRARRAVAR